MLRRKITKDEENTSSEHEDTFLLKKRTTSENSKQENSQLLEEKKESGGYTSFQNYNDFDMNLGNIGDWLVKNLFSDDIINRLKDNIFIPVPNIDKNSSASEWLEMVIKSYLPKEDIWTIIQNVNSNNKYKNIYKEIQAEKIQLSEEIVSLKDTIGSHKNQIFKLKTKIEQMIELSKFIELVFEETSGGDTMQALLLEAIDNDSDQLAEFILPFSIHAKNILMIRKYMKNTIENDINMYLDETRTLLKSISGQYIPQRKELLEELARYVSGNFKDVEFISPEEYTFVEPSIHNIPVSGGQKVVEGISFAVVKKETKQTIIYADIVAQ